MQFLEKIWELFTDFKLRTTERRKNYFVSEPNYYATNFSRKNCQQQK